MATITTIAAGDQISNSRTDINNNFTNLNSDKIETSVLDTDTALTANSDAKIATQKATKAYADSLLDFSVSSESSTGTSHLLTTTAGQRVVVWAKGAASGNPFTVTLLYNGVSKDTVTGSNPDGGKDPWALMYTETPGAASANITITGSDGNEKIMVLKFDE